MQLSTPFLSDTYDQTRQFWPDLLRHLNRVVLYSGRVSRSVEIGLYHELVARAPG